MVKRQFLLIFQTYSSHFQSRSQIHLRALNFHSVPRYLHLQTLRHCLITFNIRNIDIEHFTYYCTQSVLIQSLLITIQLQSTQDEAAHTVLVHWTSSMQQKWTLRKAVAECNRTALQSMTRIVTMIITRYAKRDPQLRNLLKDHVLT